MQVPIWNIPYRRNPFFTGREYLITHLHDYLHATKATTLTQAQAISGLGGIGKTQIAIEYAYRCRDDYRAVLWARAATRDTLIADFQAIAAMLDLPEQKVADQSMVIAAVKRWLISHSGWLLILDNADDVEMASDFLPLGGDGHILLTTRAQAVGSIANSIEVEKMESAEGMLLLLRRARILVSDGLLNQATEADRERAKAIFVALDGLPLALDQAGAYIEETNCGLSGYLDLFRTRRRELLKRRSKLPTDHPEPIATTWSLSFQRVEQINLGAADLLRFCTFLDPDGIPEEIITENPSVLGQVLQSVVSDVFKLNEAIETLRTFSFIRRNPDTKLLSLHRLVQAVFKDGMDKKTQRLWAVRAVRAVNAAFPEVTYANWTRCQQCLPHALICAEYIDQYRLYFPEAARLLNQAGEYLQDHAQYAQAEPYLQRALAIKEKVLGPEHPETATTIDKLAILYRAQGKYTQAEPLYHCAHVA